MRQQRPNLAAAAPIHNGQQPHLRLRPLSQRQPVRTAQLGNALVQVGAVPRNATSRRSQRLIPAERRQNTRLNL